MRIGGVPQHGLHDRAERVGRGGGEMHLVQREQGLADGWPVLLGAHDWPFWALALASARIPLLRRLRLGLADVGGGDLCPWMGFVA